LNSGAERLIFRGHTRGIPAAAFSSNGKHLVSVSKDGAATIWDSSTAEIIRSLPTAKRELQAVVFSADGRLLATGGYSEELSIWDAGSWELLTTIDVGTNITGAAFSADGQMLAACGTPGFFVWRVDRRPAQDGKKLALSVEQVGSEPRLPSFYITASPTNRFFAVAGFKRVHLWDTANRRLREAKNASLREGWHNLHCDPNGKRLIFVNENQQAEFWDAERETTETLLGDPGDFETHICAISPRGRWLAAAVSPTTVGIWDVARRQRLFDLPDERNEVWSLAWTPDESKLAIGLSDGGLSVWDLTEVRLLLREIRLDWSD
jgi:WD40 repeat protein